MTHEHVTCVNCCEPTESLCDRCDDGCCAECMIDVTGRGLCKACAADALARPEKGMTHCCDMAAEWLFFDDVDGDHRWHLKIDRVGSSWNVGPVVEWCPFCGRRLKETK